MTNWSRRAFVRTLGLGGVASAVPHLVVARGREGLGREAFSNEALPGLPAGAAQSTPIVQLNSNENPNGPGPKALNAIRSALPLANRYPYGEAGALTTAIARLHGVQPSQVIIGCGSAEILRMAMQAFTSSTRYLVTAAPTFEAPGAYADTFGVPIHAVRVGANLKLDLATMALEAPRAGLVYVCNPNNPTATVLSASAMGAFVERVYRAVPQPAVLVDEAYHDYVDDTSYKTSIPLAVAHRNVIVSRTCSKIHGLAGLRCGYAIAHADTIARLARFKLETGVNQLAIAAARATLGDQERIERERTINRETRELTRRMFEMLGCASAPSDTNFILVELRRDSRLFRDACRRDGVAVGRPFPPLDNHVRISIGTMEEMQRAAVTFKRVLGAS
jgi:histidinol-phosphate aminotransferase